MNAALVLASLFLAAPPPAAAPRTVSTPRQESKMETKQEYRRPPDAELKQRLTPQQYEVVCNEATEPPFRNAFWDHHQAGLYVDVASGEPLFSSLDKFDSGTGWPSFTRPVEPANVAEKRDATLGVVRTEVRSKHGDSHLGHVFTDGPAPTGLRYCINSASLRFVPVEKLESEGYGRYLPLFGKSATSVDPTKAAVEVATLAGGCFWGMEDLLRKIPGVISTRVGYTGGKLANATYPDVHEGTTGHAEAVEITFDPKKVAYADLLERWFFRMHDPTTRNHQGNDVGSQYRSAIFVHSDDQRRVAEEVKAKVEKTGKWKKPLVTEVVAAGPFWLAEDYHQQYLVKNPGGYTCHFMRD